MGFGTLGNQGQKERLTFKISNLGFLLHSTPKPLFPKVLELLNIMDDFGLGVCSVSTNICS